MDRTEALKKLEERKIRQEAAEHSEVLLAISAILNTPTGSKLFKYLFKNFEVMTAPPIGMQGMDLHEYLGFLRAGNSIYKLACEANSETTASILAKLERERYADQYEQFRIENGLYDTTGTDDT